MTSAGGGGRGNAGPTSPPASTARPSRRSSPTRPAAATRPTPSRPAASTTSSTHRQRRRRRRSPARSTPWTNITGNLFAGHATRFGDAGAGRGPGRRTLTSIVADWRYVIPDADRRRHPPAALRRRPGGRLPLAGQRRRPGRCSPTSPSTTPRRDGGGLPVADVTRPRPGAGQHRPDDRPRRRRAPGTRTSCWPPPSAAARSPSGWPRSSSPTRRRSRTSWPSTAADTGSSATARITTNPAPIVIGLSEQTAFGNVVTDHPVTDQRPTRPPARSAPARPTRNGQLPDPGPGRLLHDQRAQDDRRPGDRPVGDHGQRRPAELLPPDPAAPRFTSPAHGPDHRHRQRPAGAAATTATTSTETSCSPPFQGTLAGGNMLDPSTSRPPTVAADINRRDRGGADRRDDHDRRQVLMCLVAGQAGSDRPAAAEGDYNETVTVVGVPEPDERSPTRSLASTDTPGRLGRGDGHRRRHGGGLRQRRGGRHR